MLPTDPAAQAKQQLIVEMLAAHGRCHLQVLGSSMLPTLWPGETVLIEKRTLGPSVGDIVLCEREGRFFLHRLVGVKAGFWITRGDAAGQEDPPVSADGMLGVLAGVRRGTEWVVVPKEMSAASQLVAAVLGSSRLLASVVLRWVSPPRADSSGLEALRNDKA